MAKRDRLTKYRSKRDFKKTREPEGAPRRSGKKLRYLIQKHAARREHYDFRLEWDGALMSWAVPKGPSENPDDKRLAVHVEDHPVEYGTFEGTIPQGEYGGGTVMLWDRGTWQPDGDVDAGLAKGKLSFQLFGERLHGHWALVRLRARSKSDKDNWLLIKELDEFVSRKGKPLVEREMKSVKSGRTMDEIAQGTKVWHSNRSKGTAAKAKTTAKSTAKRKTKNARSKKNSAAALPGFVKPQLATLVDEPPTGHGWLHEIKFDGYRAITSIAGDKVAIRTRNGLDWTDRFHPLVAPLQDLPCDTAVLDGEITVTDAQGRTDFGALQDALTKGGAGIGYHIFDLLHLDGEDLRGEPLLERKARLKKLLADVPSDGPLLFSDHIDGAGKAFFARACDMHLEGIISKRADAPYRSDRSQSWLKIKCGMDQEFVIIGWRPSDKTGRQFSSLLLAVNDKGKLRYAGRVGSGYSDQGLGDLSKRFKSLARKTAPVPDVPPAIARHSHFLEPTLVAQIAFRGWTRDGLVRQGSFKGLRGDKPAREVTQEKPMPKAKALSRAKKTSGTADDGSEIIEGVRVTHPDRVLYAEQNVTKRTLIEHYLNVADRMLPHLAERPVSLVRCPGGSGKECFFQKHASAGFPKELRKVPIRDSSGTEDYLYIEDARGLVAAVQMGVLEIHIWGCHIDAVERPDRMVFDFDPDEDLPFSRVREAAHEMRDRLKQLKLESFPMVTGGKGIHVVVPLKRGHSWDQHRDFAESLSRVMAGDSPDLYVANMSKAKRKGKIFIDYLRNQRGATAIAPYSTRSRAGAFISLPVSWATLGKLKNAHPVEIGKRTKQSIGRDPWPSYWKLKQKLPKLTD